MSDDTVLEALIEGASLAAVYDEKYIVAEIYNAATQTKRLAVLSKPVSFHKEIMLHFTEKLAPDERMRIRGGGILSIDPRSRTVRTYGKSGAYGEPNVEVVERILRLKFPDYNLDIQVTDYIRG